MLAALPYTTITGGRLPYGRITGAGVSESELEELLRVGDVDRPVRRDVVDRHGLDDAKREERARLVRRELAEKAQGHVRREGEPRMLEQQPAGLDAFVERADRTVGV